MFERGSFGEEWEFPNPEGAIEDLTENYSFGESGQIVFGYKQGDGLYRFGMERGTSFTLPGEEGIWRKIDELISGVLDLFDNLGSPDLAYNRATGNIFAFTQKARRDLEEIDQEVEEVTYLTESENYGLR